MNTYTFEVYTTKNQIVHITCNQNMMDFKRNVAAQEQDIPFDHLIIVENEDKVYSQTNQAKQYEKKTQFRVYDANHLFKQFQAQNQDIYALNNELNMKNQEINDLQKNIKHLEMEKQQQVQQMQSQFNSNLNDVQNQQEQTIEQQKTEINKLQKLQEAQEKANLDLQGQIQQGLGEIKILNDTINNLNSEIIQIKAEKQEQEKQHQDAISQACQTVGQQASQYYEPLIAQQQQYINECSQQYQILYQQCFSLQSAYTEQAEAIQILEQQIDEYKEEISKLKNDLRLQKKKLETDHETMIEIKDKQISALQQEVTHKTKQYNQEKQQNEFQAQLLNKQFTH